MRGIVEADLRWRLLPQVAQIGQTCATSIYKSQNFFVHIRYSHLSWCGTILNPEDLFSTRVVVQHTIAALAEQVCQCAGCLILQRSQACKVLGLGEPDASL